MRQAFLSQVERTLPAIMAITVPETTRFSPAREGAESLLHRRKLGDLTARYVKQERYIRGLIEVFHAIDAAYLAGPPASATSDVGGAVEDEELRRVSALIEVTIARLEQNSRTVFPVISHLRDAVSGAVSVVEKHPSSRQARLVSNSSRDMVNAMIAAVEAGRDLRLALGVLHNRIETELTGRGAPAESVKDVDQFLAECWT
jgi:hypothetical protein